MGSLAETIDARVTRNSNLIFTFTFGMKMRIFFVVLARDASLVEKKARELKNLGYPYIIVCGEKVNHPNVVYRKPEGKYDAINFGLKFIPHGTDFVALNDVDTEIHNFEAVLNLLQGKSVSLIFVKVCVKHGPQLAFYSFLDALRKKIPIAASGELILIGCELLKRLLPLQRCKAEDSYILFKVLEKGGKIAFCEECYVTTKRTTHVKQEEAYKRRTVGGIYQALSMTKPPIIVRLFYTFLPFVSPMLLILGKKGYYWARGILLGYVDHEREDTTGSWQPTYA
jgi:cellulose synthase/poly-beta-1,6-N-acetylglucosamine synthase-like glycosyltransferase